MSNENVQKSIFFRENTIKTYNSIYNKWIKDKTLEEIKQNLINSNISPRTVLAITKVLKKAHPETSEDIELNHIVYFNKKNLESTITALSKDEAKKLMKVCKKEDPNFYPILLLALHAGLRRGEVFGLAWEDIDFERNHIYIRRSYNGPTKNGKHRKVPMSPELEKILRERYNLVGRKSNQLFKAVDPNLFLGILCKKANIKKITFHQLRHTFATMALDSGMSPKQVQTLLGHSKVTTTLDLYWQNTYEKTDLTFLPS